MSPHLLLHPVFDIAKGLTGMTTRKVVHPTPQDRIDDFNHSPDGLRLEASEDLFELA
jgi:hypothetical protein